MSNSKKVNTPPARVSFANVFKARENNISGKSEYSITLLFPKGADLSALEKLAQEAALAKWGDKLPRPLRNPIRNQSERFKKEEDGSTPLTDEEGNTILQDGYEHGAKFIVAKTQRKPHVVDQNVEAIIDESEFYSGCWAICSITAYAYDAAGNKGVSFNLLNVQKVKDDEAFVGGRSKPEEDFKPIAGANSSTPKPKGAKTNTDDLFG